MQFKVMIALQELNKAYDAMLAFMQLSRELVGAEPHYVADKTRALIKHDRILTDMVEPTGRTGERDYQRNLAQIRMQRIRDFFTSGRRRYR